jgi:sporulation protein YlmC with PRC-barrel domain
MKHAITLTSVAAGLALGLASPALSAQSSTSSNAPAKASQAPNATSASHDATMKAAQQCRNDLQAFGNKMQQDGYWLTGWRGYGYPMAPVTPTVAAEQPRAQLPSDAGANGGTAAVQAGNPWGNVNWQARPGEELRTLYGAANILAQRGNQQGCETVLSAARDSYNHYVADLKGQKVNASNVTGWRQQQIKAAKPVTQLSTAFRADDLVGTDVRNSQDQQLGSVDDVVLDPQSGKISYVVLSRGGFLGIGEDYIAVPWKDLQATPNMNTLVLNTTQDAMNNAPNVNPDQFTNQGRFKQTSHEVDTYWQSHLNQSSKG